MKPVNARVLGCLEKSKKGVTFDDFPTGFRLGARIFDLREMGYEIKTLNERMRSGRNRARYVLTSAKRKDIPA